MARGTGSRVVAFLLTGFLPAPQAASVARAWTSAEACACTARACCCLPAARPAPAPCHPGGGGGAPDPAAIRCHHPTPDARVPALPGLVSPRASVIVDADESPVPSAHSTTTRLGFGRVESPPPRSSGNA